MTGDVKISTQSYKIENITTIKEQLTEEIQTVGNYELKNPITFTTSYDEKEEIWGTVNEELAIYGYGKSYIATLQSLEGEIEAHIINFSEYPEEKHAKDSLLLKKKISEYFDFKKLHKQMKEKYGEG